MVSQQKTAGVTSKHDCFVSVGCYMTEIQDKCVFPLSYLIYYEDRGSALSIPGGGDVILQPQPSPRKDTRDGHQGQPWPFRLGPRCAWGAQTHL